MPHNITIVGAGALGSHLVQFLRNEDTLVRVIDFDRVESRNIHSQFHGKPSIGKKKVDALKQSMLFLFGHRIEINTNKLVADNASALLAADLVIDCLDNAESRTILQNSVRLAGTPCLHGALAADGSFARVLWDDNFVIDSEAGQGTATCENGEFLPFIAIASGYLAKAAQIFIQSGEQHGFTISPSGVVSV